MNASGARRFPTVLISASLEEPDRIGGNWNRKMRVRTLRNLAFGILAVGASAISNAQAQPTVAVSLTGDDGLTLGLQRALEKEVSRSKDLRLVRRPDDAQFVI